jgi:hypothetical protein
LILQDIPSLLAQGCRNRPRQAFRRTGSGVAVNREARNYFRAYAALR